MFTFTRLLRASSLVNRSRHLLQHRGGGQSSSSLAAAARIKMAPKLQEQITSVHEIVKSESDKSEYRGLVLKNGLKVLVISDPTTDKSAAALNVTVGSLSDPWEIPGLAHFCEHMLFLGTKKYPEENAYSQFLSNHGGMSNAYTATDHTCYFFDIPPGDFKKATDIFAQFFLEPLFDASCTSRELNAVDSEHEKNIKQDMWRLWRLEGVTGNEKHDFFKFGTGNRETLEKVPKEKGLDVRSALLDFHGKYYSSNIMSVCLLGKENLDDLSDMAVEMFGGVENKNAEAPVWNESPFTPDHVGVEIKVVPVKDIRQMSMSFAIPDLRKEYRANPGNYLSHLVGHEGEGSLLSFLKAKGWGNSLAGGARGVARGFASFTIQMNLSPEGLKHTDDIAKATFQYLNMLRKEGPKEWIFEELKNIGAMHFRFRPKEVPINYVSTLTDSMHNFEWRDILSAPYIIDEYKPELIKSMLDCLTPENVRIGLVSKDFEGQTDTTEQYYGTNYSVKKLPEEKIKQWKECGFSESFHLPTPNIFIPTNFDLYPEEPNYTKQPSLIMDNSANRLWFQQDKEYLLPTNVASFELRTPLAYQDPLSACMSHMVLQCFNDANNEHFYPAHLSGLNYSLDNNANGIMLKITGYNEKQQAMLEKVLERLMEFKINPDRFELLKESYVRKLKNFTAEQPYQHALYYTNRVLAEKFWTQDDVLAVVEQATVESCQEFFGKLISSFYVESLVHGNMTSEQAKKMGETIQTKLNAGQRTHEETQNVREYKLKDGVTYDFNYTNEVHPTNSVMTFYQVGIQDGSDFRLTALNDLFGHILEEPCFNVLRTKEQLGYIVSGGVRRSLATQGIRVIVQSEKNPSLVSSRIEEFMNNHIKKYLEEMTEEQFESNKKALVQLKLEKPKKLGDKSKYHWREITGRSYVFQREEKEAQAIETITKEDLMEFYHTYILPDGSKNRKLIVNVESKSNPGETGPGVKVDSHIDDVAKFKNEHELFSRPLPNSNL